jgi:hypothetical protein
MSKTSESKTAVAELIGELDRTRREYAKAALQVTQLEAQIEQLKDSEMRKDMRIAKLEAEISSRDEKHRQAVSALEEEFKTKDLAWAHRVRQLEIELQRFQKENVSVVQLEKENRSLREAVLENQATMEKLQAINEDLRQRTVEESKNQSAFLEAEFKRRLQESEKKFRAEAYRALSEEAKLALQGNDHLQTVLQRQNDSIEAVLLRCKTLEAAHAKVQEEQEESQQSLQRHVAEVQRLKKLLADAKQRGAQLDEALKQRRVERASLELLFVEYENTRKQLSEAKEKSRRAAREAERWRARAVQLTHELDDDQREAAEAKLLQIQAQSDSIEAHLERRRKRDAKKLESGQASTASRGPESAAWDDLSDDEVTDGAGHGGQVQSVDPMEILAMWNVSFDAWRPEGRQDIGGEDQVDTNEQARDHFPPVEPTKPPVSTAKEGTNDPQPPTSSKRIPRGPTCEEIAIDKNKGLSVLSQPKSHTIPSGARHFKGGRGAGGAKPLMPPLTELSIVSQGEFKMAKKVTDLSANRFLIP